LTAPRLAPRAAQRRGSGASAKVQEDKQIADERAALMLKLKDVAEQQRRAVEDSMAKANELQQWYQSDLEQLETAIWQAQTVQELEELKRRLKRMRPPPPPPPPKPTFSPIFELPEEIER
jgi:hypothetical protein